MIGGERNDDGIAAAAERICGAGDYRRAGIAPHRLEQNIGLHPDRRELFGDEKAILPVGHDDRAAKQRRIGHPADGLLKCRKRTEQRQKLLGPDFRATPATAGCRRRRT